MELRLMLVTILRFPDALATELAVITDVFAAVNELAGNQKYSVATVACDQTGTLGDSGLPGGTDILIVCGAPSLDGRWNRNDLTRLKVASARSKLVGAVGRGVVVLAEAGLLAGRRAAVPFALIPYIREHHADIDVRSALFCFDGKLFTCAGGLAVFDAIGHLLLKFEKPGIINDVMRKFQADRLRDEADEQLFVGRGLLALKSPLLRNAIDMLISRIDSPRTAVKLTAGILGVSRRQLERVFQIGLGMGPAEFLRVERLKRARHLLQNSSMSLIDISQVAGYSTRGGFTKQYCSRYGQSPRDEASISARRTQP